MKRFPFRVRTRWRLGRTVVVVGVVDVVVVVVVAVVV